MTAGRAAELHYADKLSHVSVFNVLKNGLKLWKAVERVIPTEQSVGMA
jgi:hypothetical protein